MSLFSSISSCTERNRLGTNWHFDYCRNYFLVRKKLKVESDISFGDSGSTFEAKSFSNICDFGQKLTKHFASMCLFFDELKYWSKILLSIGGRGGQEFVFDPAWSKNLSTYCPLSHLMPRSFPWARSPITLVNSKPLLTKREVKFHERTCISMKSCMIEISTSAKKSCFVPNSGTLTAQFYSMTLKRWYSFALLDTCSS